MAFRFSISRTARAVAVLSLVGCSTPSPVEAGSGGTPGMTGGSAGSTASGGKGAGGSAGTSANGGQSAGGSSGLGAAGAGAAAGAMNVDCSGFTASSTPAPTFCNFKFVLKNIMPQCSGASCHGLGGGNPLEIPLNDDATLMHNLETVISPDCGNIPIIKPGDAANSALSKVLTKGCSTTVPTMPYMCDPTSNCVPAAYETQIEAWIQAGAKLQ